MADLLRWRVAAILTAATICCLLAGFSAAVAQEQPADPVYPRVDAAVRYEVDAAWPQRPESVAPFGHVSGIAVDSADRVWVFNRGEDPVQVYTAEGEFLRTWGRGLGMTAHHLKLDREENVWLSDIGRHVVEKYTPSGQLLLRLGTENEAGEDETHLFMPTDMAIAADGHVYVADGYGNARVVHFDAEGRFVSTWGSIGSGPNQFSLPHAVAFDSQERLYVADRNNARVQIFNRQGDLLDSWSNVLVPWGFCITPEDDIWVCGSSPMRWWRGDEHPGEPLGVPPKDQLFLCFRPNGRVTQLWAVPKGEDGHEQPGELNWVHCLALDSKGAIYAGDILGQRAQKFVRREAESGAAE